MSVFIRRFTSDPGNSTLLDIESVNILDLAPPGVITGVGSGTALLVGEFENGPFETTEEVTSGTDLVQRYGGFGYTYAGVVANNPSARARKADGALTAEYWNGNAAIALNNKRFARLLVSRVDTSVGAVEFTRQASVLGASTPTFSLVPNAVFAYFYGTLGAAFTVESNTFTAAAAVYTTGNGVYPSTFVGGETMVLTIDQGTPRQVGPITVTFSATDSTHAQVVARINAAVGYTCAAVATLTTTFTGRVQGSTGRVAIISASALVLTALNAAITSVAGTGNVGDITAVTVTEVNAVCSVTGVAFDRDASGALRLRATATTVTHVGAMDTSAVSAIRATALGFDTGPVQTTVTQVATGAMSAQPDGFAAYSLNSGAYPTTFVGGETLILGVDDEPTVTVTFLVGDQSDVQVAARINAALGFTCMVGATTYQTFTGRLNGGRIRVIGGSALALDAIFGVLPGDVPMTFSANANAAQTIAAGTRVQNVAQSATWVTMQDVSVRATGTNPLTSALASGPYSVKVRPATDDGTGVAGTASGVTVLPAPISGACFTVTNPVALTVALTEAQIDAKYVAAIEATNSVDTVASQDNLIWVARQSNAVRNALRQDVNDASANGCLGRAAQIRPPLSTTTRAMATGAGAPGVNAYRDERVDYCFPGVQTYVAAIAARGLAGGAGFTADGVIDVGSDGFLTSICSQLAPEENPGQQTTYARGALGIEANNPDVQNMQIADYITFRANGIAAPRMSDGSIIFQSGVTSVNPSIYPQFRNIARRRMADYIQDSLALLLKGYGKKLNTPSRRAGVLSVTRTFMVTLLSPGNAAAQRIDGFKLDPVGGNTPETLALGLFRLILNVRTLSSLDSIVLQTTVGEQVDVSEAA